jgi:endonuclease-3
MASSNRATVINRLHKELKKQFKAAAPAVERSVLENLIYALCLEDTRQEIADACYARLLEMYFDWNEVRVTTVRELREVFRQSPRAAEAAAHVKDALQSVFESQYSFDLEHLKKQSQGQAVGTLEGLRGSTPFAVAYVTQHSLGGHAIPLGPGTMDVLYIVGVISEKEKDAGQAPGLARAIAKTKGLEFSSLLHQLTAEFVAAPHSPKVRDMLLKIAPDSKQRLPRRGESRSRSDKAGSSQQAATPPEAKKSARKSTASARKKAATGKPAAGPKKAKKKTKSPGTAGKVSRSIVQKKSARQATPRKPR